MGTKLREFGQRARQTIHVADEEEQGKARQVARGKPVVQPMRVDGVLWGWIAAFEIFVRMRNDAVAKDRVEVAMPGHIRFIRSMLSVRGTPVSVERSETTTIGDEVIDGEMLAMVEREWGRLRWVANAQWMIARTSSDLAVAFWKKRVVA